MALLGVTQTDKILLVTAHPDDECMFFTPLLVKLRAWLKDPASQLFILCATTGDAYGLGSVRVAEMHKSLRLVYNLPEHQSVILDDDEFRDGADTVWNAEKLAEQIATLVDRHHIQHIATFDLGGVSGHPNHIAVSASVQSLAVKDDPRICCLKSILMLRSLSIFSKYIPLWCLMRVLTLFLLDSLLGGGHRFIVTSPSHRTSLNALRIHRSQNLWYRQLFILFSAYSWLNEFDVVRCHALGQ